LAFHISSFVVTTQPNVIASIFVRSNPPAGQAMASSHKTLTCPALLSGVAMTPEQLPFVIIL